MKFFSRILDKNIGKTVIRFSTHGCMGQVDEFDYLGTIKDIVYHDEHKFYKVEILKHGGCEKRSAEYSVPTSVGYINFKTPQDVDAKTLQEIKAILKSIKKV